MDPKLLAIALGKIQVAPTGYAEWVGSPTLQYEGADNEILIYGLIVESGDVALYREWFGDESVTSNLLFREQMSEMSGDIVLRINSPGGVVDEASGMVQAIQEYDKGSVTCVVDGLAASAASLLMAACSEVTIAQLAQVMIHKSMTWMVGNEDDFQHAATVLQGFDSSAIKLYKKRMGSSEDKIRALMKAETWFAAEDAVKSGLADKVYEPPKNAADPKRMQSVRDSHFQAYLSAIPS